MTHVIEAPRAEDAESLGSVQLRAWLQTYPNEEAGIDERWIREHRAPPPPRKGSLGGGSS